MGHPKVRQTCLLTVVFRNVEGRVMAQVGEANRKDVRNAVEVAAKAQPGWAKKSPFNRQQILYYIAENLDIRRRGFARRLTELTGVTQAEAELEVSQSVARLFHWAAWADKYGGSVQETQLYGTITTIGSRSILKIHKICVPRHRHQDPRAGGRDRDRVPGLRAAAELRLAVRRGHRPLQLRGRGAQREVPAAGPRHVPGPRILLIILQTSLSSLVLQKVPSEGS